jgi:hypothetical protein
MNPAQLLNPKAFAKEKAKAAKRTPNYGMSSFPFSSLRFTSFFTFISLCLNLVNSVNFWARESVNSGEYWNWMHVKAHIRSGASLVAFGFDHYHHHHHHHHHIHLPTATISPTYSPTRHIFLLLTYRQRPTPNIKRKSSHAWCSYKYTLNKHRTVHASITTVPVSHELSIRLGRRSPGSSDI